MHFFFNETKEKKLGNICDEFCFNFSKVDCSAPFDMSKHAFLVCIGMKTMTTTIKVIF